MWTPLSDKEFEDEYGLPRIENLAHATYSERSMRSLLQEYREFQQDRLAKQLRATRNEDPQELMEDLASLRVIPSDFPATLKGKSYPGKFRKWWALRRLVDFHRKNPYQLLLRELRERALPDSTRFRKVKLVESGFKYKKGPFVPPRRIQRLKGPTLKQFMANPNRPHYNFKKRPKLVRPIVSRPPPKKTNNKVVLVYKQ